MSSLVIQLMFFILLGGTFPVAKTQEFDIAILKDKIAKNIAVIKPIVSDAIAIECTKIMEKMVGPRPDFGKVDTDSIYFRFQQAYHAAVPANELWFETAELLVSTRETLLHIRDIQQDWKRLTEFETLCNKAVTDYESFGSSAGATIKNKIQRVITDCAEEKLVDEVRTPKASADFLHMRMYKACYKSLHLVVDSFIKSCYAIPYNGVESTTYEWDLFDQMYEETKRFDVEIANRLNASAEAEDTFPKYIDSIRGTGKNDEADELEKKMEEIVARLQDPALPYHKLYFDGDEYTIYDTRYNDENSKRTSFLYFGSHAVGLLEDEVFTQQKITNYTVLIKSWDEDIKNKKYTTFISDFNNGEVTHLHDQIVHIYEKYIKIDPLPPGTEAIQNGVLVGDGEWNWDLDYPIHNMRLAWDLMGAVLEEIKCYMKETYYFDLRPEALRRTQGDIEKGALYSGLSRTVFYPCEIIDDLDLVGYECTRANNEICAPMQLHTFQRTDSLHHEGFNLLKPKWIYKYDKSLKKCVGRKDYVMKMNVCRCGFRLDCGKDLGVNMTCQLIHNDLLRGQCRGNVGYPCYTLPLSPGKFHETCKSGYCNTKKNSCEDRPYMYHTKSGASSSWKVETKTWSEVVSFWAYLGVGGGVAFI